MIRIIGAVLVTAGCSLTGWYYSEKLATRIHILEELQQSLQFLYGEIEYSADDMTAIFMEMSKRSRYLAAFYSDVCADMKKREGGTLCDIWCEHLEHALAARQLKSLDIKLLKELGANLGNLDRNTQLHTIIIFQDRLKNNLSAARNSYSGQARVCHVVGITVGIFISVLLI